MELTPLWGNFVATPTKTFCRLRTFILEVYEYRATTMQRKRSRNISRPGAGHY